MSSWAEIDENNLVLRVTVGNNDEPDEGYQWLVDNLGGTWVKTSYNTLGGQHLQGGTPFRGNYAGVGFTYDETLDAFIPPQPFSSWVLDDATFSWVAPVPLPSKGGPYRWDEDVVGWVVVPETLEV